MKRVPDPEFAYRSVLAVCAHPDDESFGLGAVLSTLAARGIATRVLCFTHGEASTLGPDAADLAGVRAAELAAATAVLGVHSFRLLSYPDGELRETELEQLCRDVERWAAEDPIDCLLAFDEGGITGHPDHVRATEAAVATAGRLALPVLAWTLPSAVATTLNGEFATRFVGREPSEIDLVLAVDRRRQLDAISCHASQSTDNPVLWRRLSLQAGDESLRWLVLPPRP